MHILDFVDPRLLWVRINGYEVRWDRVVASGGERRVDPGRFIRVLSTYSIGIEGDVDRPDWSFDEPRIYLIDAEMRGGDVIGYFAAYNASASPAELYLGDRKLCSVPPGSTAYFTVVKRGARITENPLLYLGATLGLLALAKLLVGG